MSTQRPTLTRSSLRDQVLGVLRQRLVSGELQPGEIYSAQAIAAELSVSSGPVREAMLTLVNEGHMEPVRNRGFVVVAVTDKERADILEMRTWLEIPALEKLAMNPGLLRPRQSYFQDLAEQTVAHAELGDVTAFLECDRQFHLDLIQLLDNAPLLKAVRELRDRTRIYSMEQLERPGTLLASAQEHLTILDALLRGAVQELRALLPSHLSHHVVRDWVDE